MTRSDKSHHVDTWLNGKISHKAYCEIHGISLSTFWNWIANYVCLRDPVRSDHEASNELVPVKLLEPSTSMVTVAMDLRTPAEYVLTLGSDHGPKSVAERLQGRFVWRRLNARPKMGCRVSHYWIPTRHVGSVLKGPLLEESPGWSVWLSFFQGRTQHATEGGQSQT